MGKLIVYCRAVPYKKNEVSGDCCEMYSFNDGAAQDSISGHPRGTTNQISPLYKNIERITHTHPSFKILKMCTLKHFFFIMLG